MDRKSVKSSYKQKKREEKCAYKAEIRSLKTSHRVAKKGIKEELYLELDTAVEEKCGRAPINPPKRSSLEEIGNAVTHCFGAVLSLVGYILMFLRADDAYLHVGAAIYAFGLIAMFTMSCLYHAFPYGSRVKRLFRRFDYSGIYLLIGATFAPILLSYVGGTFGIVFLVIQWAVIATGITLVGVFGPGRLRFIHIPLYIILGWCGIMFLPLMVKNGDYAFLAYILGGGVVYSLGIIPFALKGRVAHFIWHFFVLFGALIQWIGVYTTVYIR